MPTKGGKKGTLYGYTRGVKKHKPRVYVLANSFVASGSAKHQSDVDYHVVHNTSGISNVSDLVGDNASTQKGKLNGLIANNRKVFEKEMFFVGCYPYILNIMLRECAKQGLGLRVT